MRRNHTIMVYLAIAIISFLALTSAQQDVVNEAANATINAGGSGKLGGAMLVGDVIEPSIMPIIKPIDQLDPIIVEPILPRPRPFPPDLDPLPPIEPSPPRRTFPCLCEGNISFLPWSAMFTGGQASCHTCESVREILQNELNIFSQHHTRTCTQNSDCVLEGVTTNLQGACTVPVMASKSWLVSMWRDHYNEQFPDGGLDLTIFKELCGYQTPRCVRARPLCVNNRCIQDNMLTIMPVEPIEIDDPIHVDPLPIELQPVKPTPDPIIKDPIEIDPPITTLPIKNPNPIRTLPIKDPIKIRDPIKITDPIITIPRQPTPVLLEKEEM